MIVFVVVLAVIVLAVIYIVITYNSLVALKNRVKNAWSQIDVQLKRRYDLIPNLVEVAKKYMEHERETLESVIKARAQAINVSAENIEEKIKAENFLSQTLRSLFSVAERYPNLKADAQMMRLNEELISTENKIAFARQFYNDEATIFNTKIESFPTNIIVGLLGFSKMPLFKADSQEKQTVRIQFNS